MLEKHKEYLQELKKFAKEHFQKEFEHAINTLKFSPFQLINSFLIYQTLEKQEFDLLVQIPDREIRQQFYVPAMLMVALIELFRNYCLYKPEININDILMKDGKTFKIIDISGMDVKVQYTRSRGANCHSNLTMDEIKKDYIVTTLDNHKPGKSTQRNFDLYKNLFRQFFNITDDIPPSRFTRKSIVIAERNIIEKLQEFEIDGTNLKNAFPYAEITRNGTWKTNLDIDPMIYIVNDYYTAQDHILNKPDIQIDTVVFIGATKYRKHAHSAINDKNRECFKNCIFIGSEDIPGFSDIRKWEWTQEEINHFNNVKPPRIEIIEVLYPELSQKIKEFESYLHEIEENYSCSISRKMKLFVWKALKRMLDDEIDELIQEFESVDVFSKLAFEIDQNLEEDWQLLKISFNEIIMLIKKNNRKYEELKKCEFHNTIIVPVDYIFRWTEKIQTLFGTCRVDPAPFNRFLDLEKQKVLFLGFYGHPQLKSMFEKFNEITMLLYSEEKEIYERLKRKFENFNSSLYRTRIEDWSDIIDVKYATSSVIDKESFDEYDHSLFDFEFNDFAGESYANSNVDQDTTLYQIEYTDGTVSEREGSRRVLRENKPVKIANLKIGDNVKDYVNCEKEILYDFYPDGFIEQIESDSKIWKNALIRFCFTECNGDSNECYNMLRQNGFDRQFMTLKKWLNKEDKEKFPASKKDLSMIKETTCDPKMNMSFESILRSRSHNRSISIQIGRKLSDEITHYILTNEKGQFLKKYPDEKIIEIIRKNAPLKTIKSISIIGEDDDNHA